MKTDVLILSYSAHGRDFEAFMLLKYHMERAFGLGVQLRPVRDRYWIDRLRPAVLVVTDTKNPSNIVAAKYARQRGALVATIEGEGIFNPALGEEMVWGWNTDREVIEHLRLQWNEHNRRYLTQVCPELAPSIAVTGGARFDRYRIYRFKERGALLNAHNKQGYEHVIGYAGWGFSGLANPAKRSYQVFLKHFGHGQLERVRQDREIIARWLKRIIQSFPHVLFVLKQHPGDDGSFTEIDLDYPGPNVLRLKSEEKVEDLINGCDLWIDYASTTSMEAWLLNRPTCCFVPSDTSFMRMGYEQGSIQVHDDQQLLNVIGSFVETGALAGFDRLAGVREGLIEKYIGWGDGYNSLRAAKAITQMLERSGPRTFVAAPITTRLRNRGRHLARVIWTLNGRRGVRGDGFVRGRVAEMAVTYFPQIEAFVAADRQAYARIQNSAWD